MDKTYIPSEIENKIYAFWEKGGYFTSRLCSEHPQKKSFVITLPPPNVTGELHLGHAMYTIEDIMIRYHRMKGEATLWLPGFDHASIAVEYLVKKQLKKEGQDKKDLSREEFLQRATEFAQNSKNKIRDQLKSLGFSLDWSREAYTMDKVRARAVVEAFCRLYEAGLIYQGERLITWCPSCLTALSDLENVYQEEKGKLYFLDYQTIKIATTRPETIFADTAIAVNPQDKRYQKLVGISAKIPLVNRKIPIIADDLVDPEFGTGALKITPAHDQTDFEIGQKHQLPVISILSSDGRLTQDTPYPGLTIKQAREKTVEDLQKAGLLVKIEEFTHAVGHCQRCSIATEPRLSKQWFVKAEPLAREAIKAVKKGKIKIIPKRFEKTYFHWLENIHDWCISRQLWWGHRLPVWYKKDELKTKKSELKFIVGEKPEGSGWIQEQDILDTWFSSGLWPFSTLGWAEKTKDYQYFYPTTVRETGYDILFFWVAREIMLGLFLTGKVPYEIVYLHGLVRDKYRQKMSKTRGNVIDPLELTAKYGTDALRMALVVGNAAGNDLSLSEDKVRAYRNFANKIWNASRFVIGTLNNADQKRRSALISIKDQRKSAVNPDDQWILSELSKTVKSVTASIEKYRFGQAAEDLYHFFWHTYCDKYLEMTKNRREDSQSTLLYVLETSLKLLHPFMPFITEEIWSKLPERKESLTISKWPK